MAAYFAFFAVFAVDIPFGDDYPTLSFIVNFTNPEWIEGKAAQIFAQHNEHRIATLRLTLLALYAIRREVDFVLTALLGNLALGGIAFLLHRAFKAAFGEAKPWGFLPVLFLLFQPQHFQLMFWAMCSFTNVVVVLFSFLSLFFLVKDGSRTRQALFFVGAVFLAAAAAYTNGNGLFVFLAAVAVLAAKKDWRRLVPWALAGVATALFYFHGYVKNPAHPDILPYLKEHFFGVAEYFLSVAGAWADFGILRPFASVGAGFLVLAGFVYLFGRGLIRKNPFVAASTIFVLTSLAALTWTRAPFGLFQSFEPRYKFIAVVLLVLFYLGWMAVAGGREKRGVGVGFLVFSIGFGGISYLRNLPRGRDYGPVLAVNLVRWSQWKENLPCASQEHGEAILRLSVQRNIYAPPQELKVFRPKFPFGGVDQGQSAAASAGPAGEVAVSGWALDNGGPPQVVIRRSAMPGEPRSSLSRKGLVYVGKTKCGAGTIPEVARIYHGFPGLDRMLWSFRFRPGDFDSLPERPTLYFFARDRVGRENLLGTVQVLENEGRAGGAR